MGTWVISFGGFAVLYGAAACLAILGCARLAGRFPGWHVLPFLFVTLTFVLLTQHPFPPPGSLDCSVEAKVPGLAPFRALSAMGQLIAQEAAWVDWATNRTIASTLMNFVICFVIGLCLPPSLISPKRAALFGAALTFGVELTQLTGFWGLYPCAYRQFDVDDLLMNFTGVCGGAFVVRKWGSKRRLPQNRQESAHFRP